MSGLTISLRYGEYVQIGDGIRVTLKRKIKHGDAQLNIIAPGKVKILRQKLFEQTEEKNKFNK